MIIIKMGMVLDISSLKTGSIMKTIKISILFFISVTSVSCDCFRHVQGTVIDYETKLPLDSVLITVEREPHIIVYTDTLGNFSFLSKKVGLPFCPAIKTSFEKEGYKKTIRKYSSCCTDNDIVILKKEVF